MSVNWCTDGSKLAPPNRSDSGGSKGPIYALVATLSLLTNTKAQTKGAKKRCKQVPIDADQLCNGVWPKSQGLLWRRPALQNDLTSVKTRGCQCSPFQLSHL